MHVAGTEDANAVTSGVVLEFLHEADLCFLLNGFVGRTVFANAEGIVCPDELDGDFHESSHADGGLHVV